MSAGAGLLDPHPASLGGRAQGLLPAGWRGPGRRAAWRRARARRVLAALLVGVAAWLALSAFLPTPAVTGVPVLVAAHDLAAGQQLTAADLRPARWAPGTAPAGATSSVAALVGHRVSSPLSAGDALTPARLHGPGLLTGLPAGQVAARVAVPDARMTAMVRPGDHVDLIDNATGRQVGSDLLVLATDGSATSAGSGGPTGLLGAGASSDAAPGVVVAVSDIQAAALARAAGAASVGSGVTLTLRADR